ncbi:hypothetical protein BGZ65_007375 [Modicella reniformis]|uniref:Nuclear pore complex protein n=1 Tax=Modicella reniformis TaxID=1440133 RepID=A0A9P6MKP5_9FUNG|nr:hypothetical protein BGZ65_007375 [Modicella reniformis]
MALTYPHIDTGSKSSKKEGQAEALDDILGNRPEGFQEVFETGIEYQKFARALEKLKRHRKGTDSNIDILAILPEFHALCASRAEQFEHRKDSDAGYLAYGALDDFNLWQSETHTWFLLEILADAADRESQPIGKGPDASEWTDRDLIEHLQQTDNTFRHYRAVKYWLELVAPTFAPRIMTKTYMPQSSLRQPFSFANPPSSNKPEYQDPDATTRDKTKLSEINQRIEHDLLKAVWEYIRRGQIEIARNACVKAGEPWRAESISGGELYSVSLAFTDPEYDQQEGPIGNKTRSLWKGTCYALAKETSADQYERAIYGALCGDIPSVLPVCTSWEDHAWAQYNSLVESMIEARLSQFGRGGPSKILPLPTTRTTSAKDIFDGLANSDDHALRNGSVTRNASKDLFNVIQTSIILEETDQLLIKMVRDAKALDGSGTPLRSHMLRFMAHFVLLLRSRSPTVPKEEGDYFIKTYVDYLISKKLYDLAPLYASFLPVNLQVETCSSYLKTIDGPKKERQRHLTAIQQNDLDLHSILKATVDALLDQSKQELELIGDYKANMERSITAPITDQEKASIRALEWLSFDPPQYEECLHRSNYLTRKYLLQGRLNTALALYKSLPSDIAQHDLHEPTPISHEHLYYRELFNSRLLFEEWRDTMKTKPGAKAPGSKVLAWELDIKVRFELLLKELSWRPIDTWRKS